MYTKDLTFYFSPSLAINNLIFRASLIMLSRNCTNGPDKPPASAKFLPRKGVAPKSAQHNHQCILCHPQQLLLVQQTLDFLLMFFRHRQYRWHFDYHDSLFNIHQSVWQLTHSIPCDDFLVCFHNNGFMGMTNMTIPGLNNLSNIIIKTHSQLPQCLSFAPK